MKPVTLIVALAPILALQAVAASGVRAQMRDQVAWQAGHIRRCAKADTLFGRMWRSHSTVVRVGYSALLDSTAIGAPARTGSWETTSSRLVGTEAIIRVAGRDPKVDSARVEITFRFLDSIYRSPAQATLNLAVDDAVMEIREPQVDYPEGIRARGIPVVVTALFTPAQSFALARARTIKGTMGPFPFELFSWELWDINAIYRATVCGVE